MEPNELSLATIDRFKRAYKHSRRREFLRAHCSWVVPVGKSEDFLRLLLAQRGMKNYA